MRNIKIGLYIVLLTVCSSCKKYLDIVPDNIPTIENAFTMRISAERFLFTCYAYMPLQSSLTANPAFTAGDEFWLHNDYSTTGYSIARGFQNVLDPYLNYWQGSQGGKDLYQGIRDCNIFLENVGTVPDLDEYERDRWIAEAKFLKAYYHFWLIRMYGPIPLKKENLPVSAGIEEVKVRRDKVDDCFNYVVQLLDEAAAPEMLPNRIDNEAAELGRITRPIVLALKAYVLVTAASPLFNGNSDYIGFTDNQGTALFNTTIDQGKWEKAAAACKEAIELCEMNGSKLYYYSQSGQQYNVSDTTRIQLNIRNSLTEKWNAEIIWGNPNSTASTLQVQATTRGLDPAKRTNGGVAGNLGVPIKVTEVFYSDRGVPITEDSEWDYAGRYELKTAGQEERYNLKYGYTTASINFNREPRYYASLGFDGGIWYGQGRFNDNDPWYLMAKKGQSASTIANHSHNATGFWPKKLVYYTNVIGDGNTYTKIDYPWPVIRLADLYLLYAEALNETTGPGAEVYKWIDRVRERAGLQGVVTSWQTASVNPGKPGVKDGMRDIIRQERLIELAFEGQRFWDLRRWKTAISELNKPITGWDLAQVTSAGYYREKQIFKQVFTTRDYLWPIRETEMLANKNTVQNPGW
ncbi:RagB/SusD family nutrient uptake outer membrane protein [Pedobacter psychroterrae]|uniref:RagB/SusD family nutrient uptake outer membrane protein n=1 Tax=Pedobacter psychroterrae TaxID=2530453 RepID=A0A4R0NJ12_9SPHI|nr:RagB/SusD family nutrient uptake outer membrane protein [Pedobacter psychroterrae]TCC99797.1 RagB/SusD family nutrient uptake outer membrane protein [Pedobacter psychroterrae]